MSKRKHPVQELDGILFYWKRPGYYKADYLTHGTLFMHRYVWQRDNGPIPPGHHVHHIDGDRGNNALCNLECLSASEHLSRHGQEHVARGTHTGISPQARAAANTWHGSEAGRKMHVALGKKSWENRSTVTLDCAHCSRPFERLVGVTKRGFCKPYCQTAARIKSGVDNETRTCTQCPNEFTCNKYAGRKTCSTACSRTAISRSRRKSSV